MCRWDDLPAEETNAVRRTLFPGEGADLKRVAVPAGTTAPRHHHEHEEFILVLEGRVILTTADGTFPLTPGSVVRLRAHAWHEAVFEADSVLVEVNLKG
ncbi:MAG: cupin domain-containing protein [Magnetospirillum sp.]|nr:cupin domain-containing protein [Magnetospirillum sp.]